MKEIKIGLIGAGTVGGGVVKILNSGKKSLDALNIPIKLTRIVDKAKERFSILPVGNAICSDDVNDILNDSSIDIVVELIGGITFAKEVVLRALSQGKHVVTANKALIAEFGPELFECAEKNKVSIYFEASVGGGIPVIKAIREAMCANEILSVKTIINGTCNYILSKMTLEKQPYEKVLVEAQRKGYAEADPTLDVSGGDSGHKVAILASLISKGYVPFSSIYIEGITHISNEDILFAGELGYVIKLLGVINRIPDTDIIDVRVHPAMLPTSHILASVSDVYNAILLEGDAVGKILLYGRGAGEMPTASAVVSDILDVARNIMGNTPIRIPMNYYSFSNTIKVKPIEEIRTRYYLRFTVVDKPGVLASIASILGGEGISIASVIQKEKYSEGIVPVIILTHQANEHGIKSALNKIDKLEIVKNKTQLIRIEE